MQALISWANLSIYFYFCMGKGEKSCIPGQESTHIYICKMDRNNILKRTFYNILSNHRYMHTNIKVIRREKRRTFYFY